MVPEAAVTSQVHFHLENSTLEYSHKDFYDERDKVRGAKIPKQIRQPYSIKEASFLQICKSGKCFFGTCLWLEQMLEASKQ